MANDKSKKKRGLPPPNTHVFLMIIPYNITKLFFPLLRGVSNLFLKFFRNLPGDLEKTDIALEPDDYISAAILSYSFLAIVFGGLMAFLARVKERPDNIVFLVGIGTAFVAFILLTFIAVKMPSIQTRSRSEQANKYLLYALKDIQIQVVSGSTLFEAIEGITKSGYGPVSEEFDKVARRVQVGIPMQDAIIDMLKRNDSKYLRKTGWQMINSLRAGSDLKSNLQSIINDLDNEQKSSIMAYARELNLWSLVYMLFAVAIPTIGATTMVILSTFAGFGMTRNSFIMFLGVCFIVQFGLVNFVKVRRPVVEF